ncbi:MAG: hypothetical protein IPJ65_17840 [Archangiaceae bacterium]|nr:hypothetical protein [Archangiaceae bacterium]
MGTVAIISTAGDPHAAFVADAVSRRGAGVLFVDTRSTASLTSEDGRISVGGAKLDGVGCAYLKSMHVSLPMIDAEAMPESAFVTWQERYVAERERYSFVAAVLRGLTAEGRTVVNPLESIDLHFLKLHQLRLLAAAGLPVPSTLATSEPARVRAFAARHRSVIYKPFAGGAAARRLLPEDLADDRLAELAHCPVLFQEERVGDEFRVYVLDGQPVAAFQIPTDGLTGANADARTMLDQAKPAELPPATWELVIRAARALSLIFAAADLRVSADGECCLLELNPTPAISFFDDPVDGKVISRLADFLVSRSAT